MKFSFRGLVWLLAFMGGFRVLLQFESSSDLVVRALIWAYVAVVSAVMVVLAVRRGRFVTSDAALPDRWRRWMHGESDDEHLSRRM